MELYNKLSEDVVGSHQRLDAYMKQINKTQLKKLGVKSLILELFKLETFTWGGDQNNSLDKYLVSHYVKKIQSYNILRSKFGTEISGIVQGYVLNSWYNHWSSIVIEHIFKSNPAVLPSVGQIRGVDFFINDIPFDLKVTYLPNEYIKERRKAKGLPPELTFLKSRARKAQIPFDRDPKSDVRYQITEQMKAKNDKFSKATLTQLQTETLDILKEAQRTPKLLTKWLYEHQGELRFGSENRLFLVLVDSKDFTQSWKLKRNVGMLRPIVNKYLNSLKSRDLKKLEISYTFKKNPQVFKSLADIIFVVR